MARLLFYLRKKKHSLQKERQLGRAPVRAALSSPGSPSGRLARTPSQSPPSGGSLPTPPRRAQPCAPGHARDWRGKKCTEWGGRLGSPGRLLGWAGDRHQPLRPGRDSSKKDILKLTISPGKYIKCYLQGEQLLNPGEVGEGSVSVAGPVGASPSHGPASLLRHSCSAEDKVALPDVSRVGSRPCPATVLRHCGPGRARVPQPGTSASSDPKASRLGLMLCQPGLPPVHSGKQPREGAPSTFTLLPPWLGPPTRNRKTLSLWKGQTQWLIRTPLLHPGPVGPRGRGTLGMLPRARG